MVLSKKLSTPIKRSYLFTRLNHTIGKNNYKHAKCWSHVGKCDEVICPKFGNSIGYSMAIFEFHIHIFVVTTMCDPDVHQIIDLQELTSGYIKSLNYPSASPETGNNVVDYCTVKLLLNNWASVLFIVTVDGNFSIPEGDGANPQCQWGSKLWIGGNEYGDKTTLTYCGSISSGDKLRQIVTDSNTWQDGITLGYRFSLHAGQLLFRLKYTGWLSIIYVPKGCCFCSIWCTSYFS